MEQSFYGLKKWESIFLSVILILGISSIYFYNQRGTNEPTSVRITIPEGFDNQEISKLFDSRFKYFDHEVFLKSAPQGYLFPDTYYVGLYMNATTTITLLKKNFEKKVSPFISEINKSGLTLKEIILMASILEAEVRGLNDKKIVSGILWKRLKIGMALQVDSSPETYKYRGFPSVPLNNPGLESILAALRPTTTSYLYFLTDKSGAVHYAETFEEHKINRAKYLNK